MGSAWRLFLDNILARDLSPLAYSPLEGRIRCSSLRLGGEGLRRRLLHRGCRRSTFTPKPLPPNLPLQLLHSPILTPTPKPTRSNKAIPRRHLRRNKPLSRHRDDVPSHRRRYQPERDEVRRESRLSPRVRSTITPSHTNRRDIKSRVRCRSRRQDLIWFADAEQTAGAQFLGEGFEYWQAWVDLDEGEW